MYKRAVVTELMSMKKHWEVVLENMGEAVIETDTDLKITYVNSFVEKILQIKKEECFNLSVLEHMDNILEAENVDIEDLNNINNLLSLFGWCSLTS